MLGLKKTDGNLMFLYAVYLSAIFVGNVLDNSYVHLFDRILPASILAYPLTCLVVCIICELWTREDAGRVVLLGLSIKFVGVVLLGLAQLFRVFPDYGAQRELWEILGTSFWEASEHMVLGKTARFWTASIISFPCAQLMCVGVFSAIRDWHIRRTGGPWGGRWFRYLCGCLAGEFCEIAIFLTLILAPAWHLIRYDIENQMYVRGVFTLAQLPVFYALTWRRRKINV